MSIGNVGDVAIGVVAETAQASKGLGGIKNLLTGPAGIAAASVAAAAIFTKEMVNIWKSVDEANSIIYKWRNK